MHKYRIPISGHICIEAENGDKAIQMAKAWSVNVASEAQGRNMRLPVSGLTLLLLETDHNHVMNIDDMLEKHFNEVAQYEEKKIRPYLPKRQREQLTSAIEAADPANVSPDVEPPLP